MIKRVLWIAFIVYIVASVLWLSAESAKCSAKGGVLVRSYVYLVCVKELP